VPAVAVPLPAEEELRRHDGRLGAALPQGLSDLEEGLDPGRLRKVASGEGVEIGLARLHGIQALGEDVGEEKLFLQGEARLLSCHEFTSP